MVETLRHPGVYPSHTVADVVVGGEKQARLAFLIDPTGQVSPAKSTVKIGSELWVYEPDYVVWSDTEEYYPFVFESDSDWTVDVCVEAPEGYAPIDGIACVQQLVANEKRAILFHIIEVGSVPGPTKVNMKLKNPHGKVYEIKDDVGIRFAPGLAKEKGVEIDSHGRPKGKRGQ
jgi:hypothetical protein